MHATGSSDDIVTGHVDVTAARRASLELAAAARKAAGSPEEEVYTYNNDGSEFTTSQLSSGGGAGSGHGSGHRRASQASEAFSAVSHLLSDDFVVPASPLKSAAFRTPTRKGMSKDTAPLFSTTSRPWDYKPPLQPYPQYLAASSSIGKQPLSQRRNPPSVAFGTVTRDQLKLVYISQEHSRAQPSLKPSPGPDYQYGSMLGKQVKSTLRTKPRAPFTEAARPGMHLLYTETGGGRKHLTPTGQRPHRTMDPWVASRDFNDIAFLKPPSSMGPAQWRPQSPSFSFGSSQRTDWAVGGDKVPGPGYEVPTTIGTAPTAVSYRQPTWNVNFKKKVNFTSVPRSSLGKQSLSHSRSSPSYGFGKSTRAEQDAVYLETDCVAKAKAAARKFKPVDRNLVRGRQRVKTHGARAARVGAC